MRATRRMGKKSRRAKKVTSEKSAADAAQTTTTTGESGKIMLEATPTTTLLMACRDGDLDQIHQCLESGCDINAMFSLPDSQRTTWEPVATPLLGACASNEVEAARLLLNRGADVELTTPDGLTPLYVACVGGFYGMACLLIFVGRANVDNCRPGDGGTPLSIASSDGHLPIARLLINRGADVNRTYEGGSTALILACQNGHTEIARLLIDRGAEINAALQDGRTCFFLACQNNHYDVVELLMQKGAITDKADNRGMIPLEIAIGNAHSAIAELLRPGIMAAWKVVYERSDYDLQKLTQHLARSGDDSQLSAEHAAALAPLRQRAKAIRAHFAEREAGKI